MIKILNLYAGIGGNRKLWAGDIKVTAIEKDEKIAAVYKKFFPNDIIIITDAHQYLLEHFSEYDFIWSSPPCPTHTKINLANSISPYKNNEAQLKHGGGIAPRYADMTLYQEIIFLEYHFKGKYCVENVISYYEPLIKPQEYASHYYWANFIIDGKKTRSRGMGVNDSTKEVLCELKGYTWESLEGLDREKVLRNCVEPSSALYIFNCAFKIIQTQLIT